MTRAQLARPFAALPEPANYMQGVTAPAVELPDNIVLYFRRDPGGSARDPWVHHRFVLTMNLARAGQAVLNGRAHAFKPGQALLIFPYQFHYFRVSRIPVRWFFMTFEQPLSAALLRLRDRVVDIPAAGWALAGTLADRYLALAPGGADAVPRQVLRLHAGLLVQTLLAAAPAAAAAATAASAPYVRTPHRVDLLDRLNKLTATDGARLFTAAGLARRLGASTSQLRKVVRNLLGISLGRYLLAVRLRRAADLLHDASMRVGDVARACGYGSIYAFSCAFKRHYGHTPKQERGRARRREDVWRPPVSWKP